MNGACGRHWETYRVLAGNPDERDHLENLDWKDNIKTDLRKIGWGLSRNREHLQAMAMNLLVP
jgi:hypothetical protein